MGCPALVMLHILALPRNSLTVVCQKCRLNTAEHSIEHNADWQKKASGSCRHAGKLGKCQ